MAITNYLVHFLTEDTYNDRKSELRNEAVAFVKDATIIHTHGTDYYCGSGPVALKSDLSGYATTSALTSGLAGKANTSHTHTIAQVSGLQTELDSKLESADLSEYALKTDIPSLSGGAAATSGQYVSGVTVSGHKVTVTKATLPVVTLASLGVTATAAELNYMDGVTSNVQTQLNGKAASSHTHTASQVSGLATVATSGSYNDLSDKPEIPSLSDYATKSWIEEQGYLTSVSWSEVSGKPSTFTPTAHTHAFEDITFKNTGDSTRYLAGNGFFYKIQYSEIDGTPDLSNYLTNADLSNYVTESELSNKISSITPSSIGAASSSHPHWTDDIIKLTGYTEGSSTTTLNSSMTLNAALASLQNQIQERATTTTLEDYALKTEIPDVSNLATKTELSGYLPLSGGTMTGNINMQDANISFTGGTISSAAEGNGLFINSNVTLDGADFYRIANIYGDEGLTINASQSTSSGTLTFRAAQSTVTLDQAGLESTVAITALRFNSTNGFFETSDARLKDFKEDIKALDTVDKIPTKYFTWKDDENQESQIGTSAQEVEKLYPELVSKTEDDTLTVDYAKLSIIALAAIKELKAEIQSLKEEIKQLKSK